MADARYLSATNNIFNQASNQVFLRAGKVSSEEELRWTFNLQPTKKVCRANVKKKNNTDFAKIKALVCWCWITINEVKLMLKLEFPFWYIKIRSGYPFQRIKMSVLLTRLCYHIVLYFVKFWIRSDETKMLLVYFQSIFVFFGMLFLY